LKKTDLGMRHLQPKVERLHPATETFICIESLRSLEASGPERKTRIVNET
jgi:hypothetical protein